jgi:hypothetical protein
MAYYGDGPKIRHKIKDLLQAARRSLTDFRIYGSGSQIHERRVEADRQSCLQELIGNIHKIIFSEMVESEMVEADLRIYSFSYDQGKELIAKKMERHMNLNQF